ncbi:MAG TPA: hypothetical protein VGP47_01300, partial [Parachlamydiaceae bacterium]|nr:hypothetical protein [Parachlamydiaceae bacterium]
LEVFFKSLYLSSEEFNKIYSNKKLSFLELLDIAEEYKHTILRENCVRFICKNACSQYNSKALGANFSCQDDYNYHAQKSLENVHEENIRFHNNHIINKDIDLKREDLMDNINICEIANSIAPIKLPPILKLT